MAFPGTYNINYYKGDTFEFNVYPKNSDGTAFNLNTDPAYTASFTIATRRGSASTTATGLVATLVEDALTVTLTTGNTSNLTVGQKLIKTSGAGAFASNVYITAITSSTEFTVSAGHDAAGLITFSAASIYTGVATISQDKTFITCAITPTNGFYLDPTKQYVYDVQISRSASPYPLVYTILNGTITVTDEVTLPSSPQGV